jgi:hypothetical protein
MLAAADRLDKANDALSPLMGPTKSETHLSQPRDMAAEPYVWNPVQVGWWKKKWSDIFIFFGRVFQSGRFGGFHNTSAWKMKRKRRHR